MMELTGKNYIGEQLSASGSKRFEAQDPSTGQSLSPFFFDATDDEVNTAVDKAFSAFDKYRRFDAEARASFLEAIASEIMATGDSLIERCSLETGLPQARLTGERLRTVNQLKLFAAYIREGSYVDARIDKADPTRTPPKPDVRSMQAPLGPVAVFGASNFPLAFSVAGGDTASALAAGCPVVVKAHPAHPGTSEIVAKAIIHAAKSCKMPDGVFSMLHGREHSVGLAMAVHPRICAVAFTGSFRGGKALFDAANRRAVPVPVYAEMGSTNPVFILPRAMRERMDAIAGDLTASVTLGAGQFCTNPGLVFVQNSDAHDKFINALSAAMAGSRCGVMLTTGIRAAYDAGVSRLRHHSGVTMLAEGKAEPGGSAPPALLHTTAGIFLQNHDLEEEVFGPSTLAVTLGGKQETLQVAIALSGHLTATIHGTDEDLDEFAELIEILGQKAGRLIINGYPTGVEVTHAMVHSGPFPATTDSRSTSVGTLAIRRFLRPVCYQNFPNRLLPPALKDDNPLKIWRLVNGDFVR